LSAVYLIRHGQAGLRHNYDTLSGLGRTQARLLGEYLAAQKVRFSAIYAGALTRQQETAAEVRAALEQAGQPQPAIATVPGWNEFDLDQVYTAIAPMLCADDSQFRLQYEELSRQIGERDSAVHRAWTPADTAVVRAWVEGRYAFNGESWTAFQERIGAAFEALAAHGSGDAVAVFTSATPMAIAVGKTLGLNGRHVMRLAGVTYNAALTTLRVRPNDLMLFGFNGIPHLAEPGLRTFR
jgi:broad specificity phosphatase PhoE